MDLLTEYRTQQNAVRNELYGNQKIYFLREGADVPFQQLFDLTTDFMIDFNPRGDAVIEVSTDAHDQQMFSVTHIAFMGKVYVLDSPVKDSMGTFPLWKLTGHPTQAKYVPIP